MLVPFGRLGDIYGRKRMFLGGIILYTVTCLLLPFSRSGIHAYFVPRPGRIGNAAIFGTGTAILTSVYPVGERGKALGINVAATYAGLSMGPPIGGFLTQYFTWRSIFFVNVAVGIGIIILVLLKLKREWVGAKGEKFDLIGSLTYGVSLAVLITGFSQLPNFLGIWLVAAGLLGLVLFIWEETRNESPVLNVNLFRNSQVFAWSNLAALINYSATNAVGFLLALYLQYIKGFSPEHAGLVLIAQPVVMLLMSPVAGRLSDRFEPRLVASIGMALTATGLALLIFLVQGTAIWYILMSLVILGLGFGLFSSPNTNAVMSSVDKRFYGVASGTLGTMRLVGQMFSLALAVLLFALFIGHVQITPEYYPFFLKSVRTGFIIFAILCFGGIFASLRRGSVRTHLDKG